MRLSATIRLERAGEGRRVALSCDSIPGSAMRLFRHEDAGTGCLCVVCGYVVDPDWYRDDDPGRGPREVLEIYRRRGAEAAFDRNGVYAILIDDPATGTVHCAVDKYGIFPLFYSAGASGVILDTDFAALAAKAARTPDFDALEEYMALGHPCADRTFFREIRRLEPARYLRIDRDGKVGSGRYWWFDRLDYVGSRDLEACVKDNLGAFEASIADFRRIVGEPICLVSAGYDSRRILLELLRQGARPRTYTVEVINKRFDDPVSIDDAVVRRLLDGRCDRHVTVRLPTCADLQELIERRERIVGTQADEHEWVLPLVDQVPRGSGTNFDGLAGDTLCNSDLVICSPDDTLRYADLDFLSSRVWPNLYAPYLCEAFRSRLTGTLGDRIRAVIADLPENPNRLFLLEVVGRARRTTSLFALSLLATRVDSVFPYLDDRMVVSALKADPFWKREVDFQKVLLDSAYPQFRDVPSSHSPRDAVDATYRRSITHLFGGSTPSSPTRALWYISQLRHGVGARPERKARDGFLSATGRLAVALGSAAAALGLDLRFAGVTSGRLWAVPKLLKVERILAHVR